MKIVLQGCILLIISLLGTQLYAQVTTITPEAEMNANPHLVKIHKS